MQVKLTWNDVSARAEQKQAEKDTSLAPRSCLCTTFQGFPYTKGEPQLSQKGQRTFFFFFYSGKHLAIKMQGYSLLVSTFFWNNMLQPIVSKRCLCPWSVKRMNTSPISVTQVFKHPDPDGHPVMLDFALAGLLIGDSASAAACFRRLRYPLSYFVFLHILHLWISGNDFCEIWYYLVTAVI